MKTRPQWLWVPLTLVATGLLISTAFSGPDEDAAAAAMAAAVKRGGEIFGQAWVAQGKSCATCHAQGPNRMTADRLKGYPKFDKSWQKVITGQQKMNQMIRDRAGGEMLQLGSADLNALEAYVSTLR